MSSSTWLVTGASRGIGLELVRQLLASPDRIVFATCRTPHSADGLHALADALETRGTLHIVQMDVTDEASIASAQEEVEDILGGMGLDFLINNAGVSVRNDSPNTLTSKDLTTTILANVVGPALVTRAFIPLIEQSRKKVIANISTALASIGIDYGGQHSSYSISKAALNMLTYKQAKERPDLIPFVIDPGWVKTDMGGNNAALEPYESAAGILNVVASATPQDAGRFIDYKGEIVPW
ncbi:NAD(P)-binding protein [Leucogyrophana mollusca]|uniref:NAD(P)-binding protein n=1 Tax=Leucogyrophana mollusca TaxID=85980 RepID=A0ACB8BVL3_9AGAM|nr:NAD(P)-binding protein [Leucogyrophana mollusca]